VSSQNYEKTKKFRTRSGAEVAVEGHLQQAGKTEKGTKLEIAFPKGTHAHDVLGERKKPYFFLTKGSGIHRGFNIFSMLGFFLELFIGALWSFRGISWKAM